MLVEGNALVVHYEINGNEYNKCYYLTDGTYSEWSTIMKTIRDSTKTKNKRFLKQ
jgi:hypothetical protein